MEKEKGDKGWYSETNNLIVAQFSTIFHTYMIFNILSLSFSLALSNSHTWIAYECHAVISLLFLVFASSWQFLKQNELNPLESHCLRIDSTIRCHLNEIISCVCEWRENPSRNRKTETISSSRTHITCIHMTLFIWFNLVFYIHSRVMCCACVKSIRIFVQFVFCFVQSLFYCYC